MHFSFSSFGPDTDTPHHIGPTDTPEEDGTQQEQSLFSADGMTLFDVITETLKEEQTETVCQLIRQLHIWEETDVCGVTTKGDLRLDEYEYNMPESFFRYHQVVEEAREISDYSDVISGESVPEAMVYFYGSKNERKIRPHHPPIGPKMA